ncbi:MAG: acetolactate synthase small subunit [Candidatus Hydrogenedentota bacterium]
MLARVAGLFSMRGYNIESLCVGETEDPTVSRMTVVVSGDDRVLQQTVKQLNKLVEVIEVIDLTQSDFVERELVLVKIGAGAARRGEVIQIANIFRARIVDIASEAMITEVTGTRAKVRAFIDMMRPFGIQEVVRTGRVAISRSPKENGSVAEEAVG